MDVRRATAVALGAAAGASLRWALIRALGPDGLDAALLAVNVVGCLAMGLVAGLPPGSIDPRTRSLLGAGLCGSLTTWSSLALQSAAELRSGDWEHAALWLAANLALGVTAAVAGHLLATRRRDPSGVQA